MARITDHQDRNLQISEARNLFFVLQWWFVLWGEQGLGGVWVARIMGKRGNCRRGSCSGTSVSCCSYVVGTIVPSTWYHCPLYHQYYKKNIENIGLFRFLVLTEREREREMYCYKPCLTVHYIYHIFPVLNREIGLVLHGPISTNQTLPREKRLNRDLFLAHKNPQNRTYGVSCDE